MGVFWMHGKAEQGEILLRVSVTAFIYIAFIYLKLIPKRNNDAVTQHYVLLFLCGINSKMRLSTA